MYWTGVTTSGPTIAASSVLFSSCPRTCRSLRRPRPRTTVSLTMCGNSLAISKCSEAPWRAVVLRLHSIQLVDQAERLAWLDQHLPDLPVSGIIYCLTIADCMRVAGWLRFRGFDVAPYFAGSRNRGEG